jgi:hypothetical protein
MHWWSEMHDQMESIFRMVLTTFAHNYQTATLEGEKYECDQYAERWIREWKPFNEWAEYRGLYNRMKRKVRI